MAPVSSVTRSFKALRRYGACTGGVIDVKVINDSIISVLLIENEFFFSKSTSLSSLFHVNETVPNS
jgi:hypothetical protein